MNKEEIIQALAKPQKHELSILIDLLKYSNRYEISIQFWPQQTAVYIAKDGVDLKDFGGHDRREIFENALQYLHRINHKDSNGNKIKSTTRTAQSGADVVCGGGHYNCDKCGETVFGSSLHRCNPST